MKKTLLVTSLLCISVISKAQLGKQIGKTLSKVKQTQSSSDKDKYYQRIEDENKIDEFVKSVEPSKQTIENALSVDVSTLDMSKFLPTVIANADNIDFMIKTLKRDLGYGLDKGYDRYESVNQYWQICSKFYPNETKVQQAKQKMDALASEYKITSKEAYKQNVDDEKAKKIANKAMIPAVRTNKEVEQLFTQAFNKESKAKNWDRTLLKVNLISNDWSIRYHKVTGNILGRRQYACVVYKDNATGKCRMSRDYEIYQDYTGNGYSSNTIGGYGMASEDFPCENINK